MRHVQRKRRKIVIVCLFFVLASMFAGFSLFSNKIDIRGVSSADNNFNVLITDVHEKGRTGVSPEKSQLPFFSGDTIEFYPFLTSVGDSISYEVTIENKGAVDAKINLLTLVDENNPAVRFDLSGVNRWDVLKAGEEVIFNVTLYFDESFAGQATGKIAHTKIQFDYMQSDLEKISSSFLDEEENGIRRAHIDVPDFSENFSVLTISFPEGCGDKYICTYKKDNDTDVLVTDRMVDVNFSQTGTVIAKVSDGTTTVSSSHKVLVYPVMMSFNKNSNSDFHSDDYRDKINYVEFVDGYNVPEGAETFDISYYKDGSVIAYVLDNGNGGYNLYICGSGGVIAKDLSYFFYNFTGLKAVNFGKLNTVLTSGMKSLFEGCNSLETLDLSSFDTSKTVNMGSMFKGCSNLKNIYVSDRFAIDQVMISSDMFTDCVSLVGGNGTVYNPNNVNKNFARVDIFGQEGYFSKIN